VCNVQPEIEAIAEDDVSIAQDLLPGFLNEPEGLARRVETVLNPILAAPMTEPLGASPYERSPERQGDRHGVRLRTLDTRVGPVT
jgi:transposase-like protein